MYDVAIVGGGIGGMATAARLQARGLSTVVFEAHGLPGGRAGFYRHKGFAFDVGATPLVDFGPGGAGGELLADIGMPPVAGAALPGYVAWLPDRVVTLHSDPAAWQRERLRAFGDTPAHRDLWHLLDRLAAVVWRAGRHGIRLPPRSADDALRALHALGPATLPLARYACWTMGDALRACGLRDDRPLVGLLSLLIEDTVHGTVDEAPLINAALGITIRGAGLTRPHGGMRGFWQPFVAHYRAMGGDLRLGCPVERIDGRRGRFVVSTPRGAVTAGQVVSSLPAALTAQIAPPAVARALRPLVERDAEAKGGAVVVHLGVPEEQVTGQAFTHHHLLQDYARPLGDGNSMFISVSAPGDTDSAPEGYRAVTISTHCDPRAWEGLTAADYDERKQMAGERLVALARRVYPTLGQDTFVYEVGTPRTYVRSIHRPRGAVGGPRLTPRNADQRAIPRAIGLAGFWLTGDTTWPGLGMVAGVLGSRIVAEGVARLARRRRGLVPSTRVGGIVHGWAHHR